MVFLREGRVGPQYRPCRMPKPWCRKGPARSTFSPVEPIVPRLGKDTPEREPAMPDRPERIEPTYQVLVDDIKALGVEQVFGLMSDDTAVFATALDSAGIRFYGARHENN